MARSKNDIERYLNGEMTPAEMHALEREALHDPFLSEALEGIDEAGTDSFLYDLKQLHNSVRQRTSLRKTKIISMWNWSLGIAAGLILLAVTSVYIISIIGKDQQARQLAKQGDSAAKTAPSVEVDSSAIDKSYEKISALASEPSDQKAVAKTQPGTTPDIHSKIVQPSVAATETKPVQSDEPAELSETGPVRDDAAPKEATTTDKTKAVAARKESGERKTNAKPESIARTVAGKVVSSDDKSALPGVNVVIKGTNIGTVTDGDGNYQLSLTGDQERLIFSFIGLQSVEAEVPADKNLNVEMTNDFSQLSEVVVTGYGASNEADDAENFEFAQPSGGRKAFKQYLEEKMQYPDRAIENKVEGKVTIEFSVDTNGQLDEFKVLKGIGYGCDDEVIRLVKQGPRWSPSKRNSQPVKDKVRIRFKFDLPEK